MSFLQPIFDLPKKENKHAFLFVGYLKMLGAQVVISFEVIVRQASWFEMLLRLTAWATWSGCFDKVAGSHGLPCQMGFFPQKNQPRMG